MARGSASWAVGLASAAALVFGSQACIFTLGPIASAPPDAEASAGEAGPEGDAASPTCTPMGDDPDNCGACGHRCLGGGCAAGRCQPFVLAADQPGPLCLARDAANLYWATTSADDSWLQTLRTVPTAGGPVREIATRTGQLLDCAIDDVAVYYMPQFNRDIRFVPKAGAADLSYAVQNTMVVGGLSVDPQAGRLYWASSVDGGYAVSAAPLGRNTSGTLLATTPSRPYATAFDDARVVFTSRVDGSVRSVAKAGGAPSVLAVDAGAAPSGLAVDGDGIYWADQSGAIRALVSGAVVLVATDDPGPEAVAVDASHVYWVNAAAGTVRSAPKTGGPSVLLASGQKTPWRIVVDGSAIYWINNDRSGSVMKLAK